MTQDLVLLLQEAELLFGGLSHLANEVKDGGGDRTLGALGFSALILWFSVELQRLDQRRLLHRRAEY